MPSRETAYAYLDSEKLPHADNREPVSPAPCPGNDNEGLALQSA
jgi:hypothetical protein